MESAGHRDTLIQHLGEEKRPHGAVVGPIYQNSLFTYSSWDEFKALWEDKPWDPDVHVYSRVSNPTLRTLEIKLAALERADEAKVFSSGMAAISAGVFSSVQSGGHIVSIDTVYGPTRQLLEQYLPTFGVTTTFVDPRDTQGLLDAIRPETSLIYLESPSSLIFRLQDLRAITRVARDKGITTAIDNSYASPIFQRPIEHGVDIVLHSASKYLNGHSDVVAGALCTDAMRMDRIVKQEVSLFGGTLAPLPAWLMLRGLRTLPIRMRAHQEAGNVVAEWLAGQPEVERVFHIGDPGHEQRDLICRQMDGSGGLLSFIPKVQEEARIAGFVESLRVFQLGVSWGGFESLVVPIHLQTIDWPEPRWIVRLFCGLESPADLVADLEQAFAGL